MSCPDSLYIEKLKKTYRNSIPNDSLEIFRDLNMTIPVGKVACIMGPSGCGKTTLLNIISGLVKPDSGEFKGFNGKTVSYMFQEPRLLPWKTVKQNIDFVIRDLYPKQLREEKIAKYLDMVELSDFGDYWPDNLSGGMKQRVGIARAFIFPSQILLMDEPFKGLDLQLKIALLDSFRALWEKDKRSVIFVTHDPDEALYIADEVFVLTELPAKVRKAFTIDLPREQRRYGEKRYTGLEEILLDKPAMQ